MRGEDLSMCHTGLHRGDLVTAEAVLPSMARRRRAQRQVVGIEAERRRSGRVHLPARIEPAAALRLWAPAAVDRAVVMAIGLQALLRVADLRRGLGLDRCD